MISNQFSNLMENLLAWTSKRQQAIAANIANIDTPGYRATDYSFQQDLNSFRMAATSEKHQIPADLKGASRQFEVESRNARDNGNTVDLDREMTEMAKNGLQYLTVLQILNSKLRTMRSAIQEGGMR